MTCSLFPHPAGGPPHVSSGHERTPLAVRAPRSEAGAPDVPGPPTTDNTWAATPVHAGDRRGERHTMRRFAILLAGLAFATTASANGIVGTVTKTGGAAVWPCNIGIVNRQTGQPVAVSSDSTLPNGTYNLPLPDGRYDLTFKPKIGTHVFQGVLQDQRVQANTITANIQLLVGRYLSGKVVGTNGVGVPTTTLPERYRPTC